MATYAGWAASRQSAPSGTHGGSSMPVKLIIDSQGNVLQDVSTTSMPTDFESSMMEETPMSVDDQLDVVQGIRARQRSNDSDEYQQRQPYHTATLNDEQRLWSAKALPSSTILLVIGEVVRALDTMHVSIDTPIADPLYPRRANTDTNWLLSHLRLFVHIEQLVARNESNFAPVVFIIRKL